MKAIRYIAIVAGLLLLFLAGMGAGVNCAMVYEDGSCATTEALQEANAELYDEVEGLRENQKATIQAIQYGAPLSLCLIEQYTGYTVEPCTIQEGQ